MWVGKRNWRSRLLDPVAVVQRVAGDDLALQRLADHRRAAAAGARPRRGGPRCPGSRRPRWHSRPSRYRCAHRRRWRRPAPAPRPAARRCRGGRPAQNRPGSRRGRGRVEVDADLVIGDVAQKVGKDQLRLGRQPLPVGVVVARRLGAQIVAASQSASASRSARLASSCALVAVQRLQPGFQRLGGLAREAGAAASPSSCSRCPGRRRGCRRPSAPSAGPAARCVFTALAKSRTVRGSARSRFCAMSDISR